LPRCPAVGTGFPNLYLSALNQPEHAAAEAMTGVW
jgi:hypothetical protein